MYCVHVFAIVYVFVCTIVVCGCICLYVYVPPMRKSGYADHCEVKSSINQSRWTEDWPVLLTVVVHNYLIHTSGATCMYTHVNTRTTPHTHFSRIPPLHPDNWL